MIEDNAERRAKCIIYVYVKTGINLVHASAASLSSMGTVSEVLSQSMTLLSSLPSKCIEHAKSIQIILHLSPFSQVIEIS